MTQKETLQRNTKKFEAIKAYFFLCCILKLTKRSITPNFFGEEIIFLLILYAIFYWVFLIGQQNFEAKPINP